MSKKEETQNDWIDLYEYVKKDIMEYPNDFKLPKYMVLRLRGLAKGQFIANKKHKPIANYEYKTILYTFKACKLKIIDTIKNTVFNNEQHKFNYIMVVIENNINDMVIRLKNAKKSEEKTINIKLENHTHENAEYKTKSKNINKDLEELW